MPIDIYGIIKVKYIDIFLIILFVRLLFVFPLMINIIKCSLSYLILYIQQILNTIYSRVSPSISCQLVLLNISCAFDSLSHSILISIL